MKKRGSSHQRRGEMDDEKRRRKEEQHIKERLQKVQEFRQKAEKRLQRSEERLQQRLARLYRLEERLEQLKVEQTPTIVAAPEGEAANAAYNQTANEDGEKPLVIIPPQQGESAMVSEHPQENKAEEGTSQEPPEASSTVASQALEARAAAEAAEEAARVAAERADSVMVRLDHFGGGRHLAYELAQLQTEAERTREAAEDAELVARKAELLAAAEKSGDPVPVSSSDQPEAPARDSRADVVEQKRIFSEEHAKEPTPEETAQVEEIEGEEEHLETVVSMIIAEAAAAAAAEAEALAEASSTRTRDARLAVQEAEKEVERVHAAMREGNLTEEEGAEAALRGAEQKLAYMHMVLADAEQAERQAVNVAMNAEAEAEVAEGMAFASWAQEEHPLPAKEQEGEEMEEIEDKIDLDDTIELPGVRPQE